MIMNNGESEALTVIESNQNMELDVPNNEDRYRGMSMRPATDIECSILLDPVEANDIEIRPDGMIYLPEIKYRRRLNKAYGPGGWALRPMSSFSLKDNTIMRQFALYVMGNFVSEAVGEQEYIESNPNMTYATAAEGCKSNAMMRCCKDLGIASELWDPNYIEKWKKEFAVKSWNDAKKKYYWRRKDREPFKWEKDNKPKPKFTPAPDLGPTSQPEDEYPEPIMPEVDRSAFEEASQSSYHAPDKCGKCGAELVYHEEGKWGPWWSCSKWRETNCDFKVSKKKWDKETNQ